MEKLLIVDDDHSKNLFLSVLETIYTTNKKLKNIMAYTYRIFVSVFTNK